MRSQDNVSYMNLTEMIGRKFGKWEVFARGEYGKNNCLYWWCRCACGRTEKQVSGTNLRSGESTQCRKCSNEESFDKRFKNGGGIRTGYREQREDLTGKQFNGLIVLERTENIGTHPAWIVECVYCGTKKPLREQAITSLRTKSCGCRQIQGQIESHTTHGMSRSPEYSIWRSMKKRCYDRKHVSYENYGGRGISMCKEWLESFEKFFACVGKRPSKHHQLHRIDNNGNYEPGNWEWTTRTRNMRDRRNTRFIFVAGARLPLNSFCESIGISTKAVAAHLDKGRTLEESISIIRPVITE